jgi:CO/xanthine dehydrogenase Mo-binding subunit
VTVFTGSIDTGQGKHTGFAQIVADELDAPVGSITIVPGDTGRTPVQGGSGGANGIIILSQPVRYAAAEARLALLNLASTRFGVPVDQLTASDGVVSVAANPSQKASYGELIGGRTFNVPLSPLDISNSIGYIAGTVAPVYVTGNGHVKPQSQYKVIGTSVPRIDIPDKVTGKYTYVQNIRLPGMVHARLVLPPSPSSNLVAIKGFVGGNPKG